MATHVGPPPPGGDKTRAPVMIGVFGAMTLLSIFCAVARIYTRVRLLRMPGMDDAVVVFTIALIVTNFAALIKATTFGLGRHEYYLSTEDILQSLKWDFVIAPLGIMGVAIPKLAVVIFLGRVVGPTKRLQISLLYFLIVTLIIFSTLSSIFRFVKCSPPSAGWRPSIPHKCWNPAIDEKFSFFVGAYSAFTDFTLAIFPATVILKLQMSRIKRIGISFLMSLGILAGVCAIVRTTKLAALRSPVDWTWRSTSSIIWTVAEMNVIIICACVPTLPPLVQQLTGRKDYLSERKAGSLEQKRNNMNDSKRPLWDSVIMRPMKSQGTVNTVASHNEEREGSLPSGEIRTTTELQTQWEAV